MIRPIALSLALMAGIPAMAQGLPDKPKPVIDREFKIQVISLGAAYTFDVLSTKHWLANCPQTNLKCVERGYFGNGTRSMPKITLELAAFDGAMVVLAYEWKKHVRNKYLHPLWRIPMLYQVQAHTMAAVGSYRHY